MTDVAARRGEDGGPQGAEQDSRPARPFPSQGHLLERYFRFRENGTSLGTDTRAGLVTFLVMSYIIPVNAGILGFAGIPALAGKGLPFAALVTSTCLVAAVTSV